jgi:hypothetical protein
MYYNVTVISQYLHITGTKFGEKNQVGTKLKNLTSFPLLKRNFENRAQKTQEL